MELNTQRLLLRPWVREDTPALYDLARDAEIGPNCGWNPHKSMEESDEILRKVLMNRYTWAIVLKETGEVIGDISLMPFGTSTYANNQQEKEIGFWLGRPYWGRGYMPEACMALLSWAFDSEQVNCVWCAHRIDNQNSARVQEKCGFRFHHRDEGRYSVQLDRYDDLIVNCWTREEWIKRK